MTTDRSSGGGNGGDFSPPLGRCSNNCGGFLRCENDDGGGAIFVLTNMLFGSCVFFITFLPRNIFNFKLLVAIAFFVNPLACYVFS